jgi:23S rRNA (uracil1939-C5)-methyltransferase
MPEASYKKGDVIALTVTDLAEKDQCFGRLDNGMGVMVGGMLAVGDRVAHDAIEVGGHVGSLFERF